MRRALVALSLALAACRGDPAPDAPAPVRPRVHAHLPVALRDSVSVGRLDPNRVLELRVHVGPRNEAGLEMRLEAAADPQGPAYGDSLTPELYRQQHAPTQAQLSRVTLYLVRYGLTVTKRLGSVLHARGTVAQAEAAFGTELHRLKKGGRDGFAPLDELRPSAPDLDIVAVHGLFSKPPRRPHVHAADARAPLQPFGGAALRKAYGLSDATRGQGARLGVLELDGYDPRDLQAYARENGFVPPTLNNINVDGFDGSVQDPDAQVETTLDLELMMLLAPMAEEIRVYQAANTAQAWFDLLNEMASPTLGDRALMPLLSISWGRPEDESAPAQMRSEFVLLRQMAAQGQTVFVAAGDAGARDDGSRLGVDDPANQPWAVAVGGTRLVAAAGGGYGAESTWRDGGGGASRIFGAPSWQAGLADALNRGPRGLRLVPDVAAAADPATGHRIVVRGDWMVVGGTSAAAPLWAALMADAAAQRLAQHRRALPFLAPTLYRLATLRPGRGLRDIADGSTNGYYPAVTGFDLATGLGSFDAQALVDALAAL